MRLGLSRKRLGRAQAKLALRDTPLQSELLLHVELLLGLLKSLLLHLCQDRGLSKLLLLRRERLRDRLAISTVCAGPYRASRHLLLLHGILLVE